MAKMSKKGKKRFRIIILFFILIIIGIIVIANNNNNNKIIDNQIASDIENISDTENILDVENISKEKNIKEEFVEIVNGGVKLNVSDKLKQEKTIDGLIITNVQLTYKKGESQFLADVKNPTNSKGGDFSVLITALDKEGNEILQIHGYISALAPGATTQLSTSITDDYANAYDFKIEKE